MPAIRMRQARERPNGEIADRSELVWLDQVSRARVTQIMSLLSLAPDIQEEILFLPRTQSGRDSIREAMVRPIAAVLDWGKQRGMWREVILRKYFLINLAPSNTFWAAWYAHVHDFSPQSGQ